jgi:hypothetical protein
MVRSPAVWQQEWQPWVPPQQQRRRIEQSWLPHHRILEVTEGKNNNYSNTRMRCVERKNKSVSNKRTLEESCRKDRV